jgi:hypothetical protein
MYRLYIVHVVSNIILILVKLGITLQLILYGISKRNMSVQHLLQWSSQPESGLDEVSIHGTRILLIALMTEECRFYLYNTEAHTIQCDA